MDPVFMVIAAIVGCIIIVPMIIKAANSHHCKWGDVIDDKQTCEGCNKVRTIGPKACKHQWEKDGTNSITAGNVTKAIIHNLRCSKCGDMKEYRIDA